MLSIEVEVQVIYNGLAISRGWVDTDGGYRLGS